MRLNKFIARYTGLSRRAADAAITAGKVTIDGKTASLGADVAENANTVALDGRSITPDVNSITIMLNKPSGYVCSRDGQGSHTIYDLLPDKYQSLKSIGRLDKNSSGLLLLTNDGDLANELTHPSNQKQKEYEVQLDNSLSIEDVKLVSEKGVLLGDGLSKLGLKELSGNNMWQVTMHEGRNRQIRRTFEAIGYSVIRLHRISFGPYKLGSLEAGKIKEVAL